MVTRLTLLALLALALAAQPTIGTVTVVSGTLTPYSVQITFTASSESFCWAEFDTDSGEPYARNVPGFNFTSTTCYVNLTNLTPSTTYFVRGSGRPNRTNTTGIGYGAQVTITTPAAPSTPVTPTLPTTFTLPIYPDTTGYTTLTRSPSGTGPDNCDLQSTLNLATYGTIIELPQGAVCNTPSADTGFVLPRKAIEGGRSGIDDAAHRWIIIRTARAPALLPPDGTRTGLVWKSTLASLRAQVRHSNNSQGSILKADVGSAEHVHHYWIDNVNLAFTNAVPADAQNPAAFTDPIYIQSNFTSSETTGIPQYVVLDRILLDQDPPPFRLTPLALITFEGRRIALENSYIQGHWWVAATNTLADATRSGNTITQTAGAWQRRPDESTWTIGSTVTAAGTLSAGYAGSYAMYLTGGGVTLEYTTPSGGQTASWVCTGCTATPVTTPAVPASARQLATGTISAGAIVNLATFPNQGTFEGSTGVVSNTGPGPAMFENNFISSPLIAFFSDMPNFGPKMMNDVVFRRNYVTSGGPQSFRFSPLSNGWNFLNRSAWEIKKGERWAITGNIFADSFGSVTNNCATVVWSSRGALIASNYDVGIRDQTFRHNTIRASCAGLYIGGQSELGGSTQKQPPLARNFLIENNLFDDIDGTKYTTNTTGALAGNIGSLLNTTYGLESVTMRRNSLRRSRGAFPAVFFGTTPGAQLRFTDNLISLAAGGATSESSFFAASNALIAEFPGAPPVTNTAGNFAASLATAVGGVTVTGNVLIGARKLSGVWPGTADLSSAEMTTIASGWPGGNTFVAGANEAARETAAGLMVDGDLTYASAHKGSAGADLEALAREQGALRNVRIFPTSSQVVVHWTAPDAFACTVDRSTNGGATWTRATASGGAMEQSITFSATSATVYQLRVICAVETQILPTVRTP
jgi:hypothetical protein